MEITVCPGASTFVGGDITAGMYAMDFDKREKPCVLIDLGTNGEMAVGCRDRILVTSTAAGPAFEGGNSMRDREHPRGYMQRGTSGRTRLCSDYRRETGFRYLRDRSDRYGI